MLAHGVIDGNEEQVEVSQHNQSRAGGEGTNGLAVHLHQNILFHRNPQTYTLLKTLYIFCVPSYIGSTINGKKGAQTKGPKNTDKRATDKKAKKADKRAKNQSYILIVFSMQKLFFQCNKTDLELDLFEDVSIFFVWLGRFAPFAK